MDEEQLPAYSPHTLPDHLSLTDQNVTLSHDGRLEIDSNSHFTKTLAATTDRLSKFISQIDSTPAFPPPAYDGRSTQATPSSFPLRLNIVIQIVGSRGDVQPFLALAKGLVNHDHRVRIATHAIFQSMVLSAGMEFFDIGGHPHSLMAYMVKNPSLIPSTESLRNGDIGRKRAMMAEILDGCWRSCIEPDPQTHRPFVADAIIANPPSFAHVHCAEALGVPVHVMFTMPWTMTGAFPHPFARLKNVVYDSEKANRLSYLAVQWLTWQGLGDVINTWRKTLGLEEIPWSEGPMVMETLRIPHTYCWSPSLIAKPRDWGDQIDVSGFLFDQCPVYDSPKNLLEFLNAGPPPVYIGFGSIVLEDSEEFVTKILDAVTACGVRAIISRGWSDLRGIQRSDVFWLGDCPHEWLFQHVSMVIHHGGAGTTACGLRHGRPTVIVPFFGDQTFWGERISVARVGPDPIPHKELTSEKLQSAIRFCQSELVQEAAMNMSKQISGEDGVTSAVASFHAHLPLKEMRCEVLQDRAAVWKCRIDGKSLQLSNAAAQILISDSKFKEKDLKRHRSRPINIENQRWDPVTGLTSSLIGTSSDMIKATTGIFYSPYTVYNQSRKAAAAEEDRLRQQDSGTPDTASQTSSLHGEAADKVSINRSTLLEPADDGSRLKKKKSMNRLQVASQMGAASATSLGTFFTSYSKGVLVDMPLAAAEGFRLAPKLWDGETVEHRQVTDWKSGGIAAGEALAKGFGQGFRDLVVHPVNGARKEGALGAVKGLATGTASLICNSANASLGLVAYPGQGIAKSLHGLVHGRTERQIMAALKSEREWQSDTITPEEGEMVQKTYEGMIMA